MARPAGGSCTSRSCPWREPARSRGAIATWMQPACRCPGWSGRPSARGSSPSRRSGGATLTATLTTTAPLPMPAAILELSQRFAASGIRGSRDPRAFADPVRHVALLSELLPHRADEIAALARVASEIDAALVGAHGDLHPGQLLLGPDGAITGVLDVDGAGQGYQAHDAGNLIAHLGATADLHPPSRAVSAGYAREVEAAYAEVVGIEPLARATAAAWLGLATSAHRAQEPSWREQVEQRVDRAAQLLHRC